MAEKSCVFLRGINVNGIKLKMDELKRAFEEMAYMDAITVLATGNVIISCEADGNAHIKAHIEEGLSKRFGYDAFVFLRSEADIRVLIDAANNRLEAPGCHIYCIICQDDTVTGELDALFERLEHRPGETFTPLGQNALWTVPQGETLVSAFGTKALGDKRLKSRLTSRNLNTMVKILDTINKTP